MRLYVGSAIGRKTGTHPRIESEGMLLRIALYRQDG